MIIIYKIVYWHYLLVSSGWYWARRRFSKTGLCVLGALPVTAAVGADIDNTVSSQAFALLLALVLVAAVFSFRFRATFSARRILPRVGTAGQLMPYRVQIKNLTKETQLGLTLLENLADPRPSFADWLGFQLAESRRVKPFRMSQRRSKNPFRQANLSEGEIPAMLPGAEVEVPMQLLPLRRGVLNFSGVTIARPDPLNLFRALARCPAPQKVLILPRRYALPDIALPGAFRYQQGGVSLAANVGASEEFVSLRDYRHGDPLRHIHWRSWAKTGKPIVREFEDEFFVRHALVLDTFDDEPNSEVLEEAVSVAASFACTMLSQESLLDLLFVGNQSYCFTAGRGLAQADQMLEILASVKNCADKKFDALEDLVVKHAPAVSGCICVLQRWDSARKKFIEKLKAMDVPLLILIVVPRGGGVAGGGPLADAEGSLNVLEVGKITEGLAKLK